MADTGIRVGKVSSVNYQTGMAQIVYTDKGQAVTAEMPLLNYNDEYNMPTVGSQVAVAHLENGSSRGVILGNVWDKKNTPAESGSGLYRKDFSKTTGAAYARYSDESGEYIIHAPAATLNGLNSAKVTGAVVELSASGSVAVVTPLFSLDAPAVKITGGEDGKAEITNEADITFTSSEKGIEAEIKSILTKVLEGFSLEVTEALSVKTDEDLELEDASFKTTLSKILKRLEALDGDSSARK